MDNLIQYFTDKTKAALKISHKDDNVNVENLSSEKAAEIINNFMVTDDSSRPLYIDTADIKYVLQDRDLECIFVEIDSWKNLNDFYQKIDKIMKYIKPNNEILCAIESGEDIELDQYNYIAKAMHSFKPKNGSAIVGLNIIESLLGKLNMFICWGI